jgi:hypothetical protein
MRPVADWDESDLDELHRGEIMESLSLCAQISWPRFSIDDNSLRAGSSSMTFSSWSCCGAHPTGRRTCAACR